MAAETAVAPQTRDSSAVQPRWAVWLCSAAPICIAVGLYWDICWHESIGRDTFWTPAHLLIQSGALLAGLSSAWVIFSMTFGRKTQNGAAVRVLGFRGPLGNFICAWGAAAMLTSAPFDNWWHEAYGLDVKIISPPHAVLAMGIAAIMWGSVILIMANLNRAEGSGSKPLLWLLLLVGGFMVTQDMIFKLEWTTRSLLHSAVSYMVISIVLLLVVEALARASGLRWARTILTGVYTGFMLVMLWLMPLFAAQPRLGPVYQHITHMVALPFPILIIVPATVLDWTWPVMKNRPGWMQAAFAGSVFLAALIAVQWPFADFLMSPAARNWLFGTNRNFPYFLLPSSPGVNFRFVHLESTTEFVRNLAWALCASVMSAGVGLVWGNWLRKVRR